MDEFAVIDKEELERVLAKYREAAQEQKKVQAEQLLDTVVKQYREERQRDLSEDH